MSTKYKIKDWLKAAGIRAIKTFIQSIIALTSVTVFTNFDSILRQILIPSTIAAVLSLLTSMATGLPEIDSVPQESIDLILDILTEEQKQKLKDNNILTNEQDIYSNKTI